MALKLKQVGPTIILPGTDSHGHVQGIRHAIKEGFRLRRRRILEPFANADPPKLKHWVGQWFDAPDEHSMATLQAELRSVWDWLTERPTRMELRASVHAVLNRWMEWHRKGVPLICFVQGKPEIDLSALVNPAVLRFQLALGLSELRNRVYRCANPRCPRPFRIRERRGQLFCERSECRRMAELAKRRRWWNRHGEEWRRERKRSIRKNSKVGRRQTTARRAKKVIKEGK